MGTAAELEVGVGIALRIRWASSRSAAARNTSAATRKRMSFHGVFRAGGGGAGRGGIDEEHALAVTFVNCLRPRDDGGAFHAVEDHITAAARAKLSSPARATLAADGASDDARAVSQFNISGRLHFFGCL